MFPVSGCDSQVLTLPCADRHRFPTRDVVRLLTYAGTCRDAASQELKGSAKVNVDERVEIDKERLVQAVS